VRFDITQRQIVHLHQEVELLVTEDSYKVSSAE
jgi:hypothetical protein